MPGAYRATRRARSAQRGGKTFKANRPPANVNFKLLNIESIIGRYRHPALNRSNHSWAAIKETKEYATLKQNAEKLSRREDLGNMYALYMLVNDNIICAVTFIPNITYKYKKWQMTYKPRENANSNSDSNNNSNNDSDNNSNNNSNNDDQPAHISFREERPQDLAYIDYLTCAKDTSAYKDFPHRPASHYLLYQAVKLIHNVETRFISLNVAADVDSPSGLYMFYKRMGFYCFPHDKMEYRTSSPFLFTREGHAERVAMVERLKRGRTYLNEQENKPVHERNALNKYLTQCAYMVGFTEDILEKLTATVRSKWDPPV